MASRSLEYFRTCWGFRLLAIIFRDKKGNTNRLTILGPSKNNSGCTSYSPSSIPPAFLEESASPLSLPSLSLERIGCTSSLTSRESAPNSRAASNSLARLVGSIISPRRDDDNVSSSVLLSFSFVTELSASDVDPKSYCCAATSSRTVSPKDQAMFSARSCSMDDRNRTESQRGTSMKNTMVAHPSHLGWLAVRFPPSSMPLE
mmetsp:Transcript_3834/g.10898  ORF Transcript_3834/g.10898 Transcript_3834/m.10898 type:complete len:203 (+) Transcript_3834:2163-2771(+)